MIFVDSHVNLHHEKYDEDLQAVLDAAKTARVAAMLTISDRLDNLPAITAISHANEAMWHSVGVHPHYASDYADLSAEELIGHAENKRAVGIGECGLDYYYEYSDRTAQAPVFQSHIAAAQASGLPLIIHTRNADDDMQGMLIEAHADKTFIPLMHCYTSGPALAETALTLGGYVSFSGIITFKNAKDVQAIAEMVPLERMLIETDCPYLAPVPHRGRRNEPAFVPHVADKLAELKGVSIEEIAAITTDNFFKLFAKADRREVEEGS